MQDKDASAKTLRSIKTPARFHLTGDFYRYSFIDGRPSGDRGIDDWRGAREHRQPVTDDRDDHRANLFGRKSPRGLRQCGSHACWRLEQLLEWKCHSFYQRRFLYSDFGHR